MGITWKNVWFVDVVPAGQGINGTDGTVVAVEFSSLPYGTGESDPILEFFTVGEGGEFLPISIA